MRGFKLFFNESKTLTADQLRNMSHDQVAKHFGQSITTVEGAKTQYQLAMMELRSLKDKYYKLKDQLTQTGDPQQRRAMTNDLNHTKWKYGQKWEAMRVIIHNYRKLKRGRVKTDPYINIIQTDQETDPYISTS